MLRKIKKRETFRVIKRYKEKPEEETMHPVELKTEIIATGVSYGEAQKLVKRERKKDPEASYFIWGE